MALLADEHVASLVLLWLVRDAKEGWERWGRVSFVNKAWRNAFKTHKDLLIEYRFAHMQHMIREKNRQLHMFRVCCNCSVAFPSLWSSDDVSDDEASQYHTGSPVTSPEY